MTLEKQDGKSSEDVGQGNTEEQANNSALSGLTAKQEVRLKQYEIVSASWTTVSSQRQVAHYAMATLLTFIGAGAQWVRGLPKPDNTLLVILLILGLMLSIIWASICEHYGKIGRAKVKLAKILEEDQMFEIKMYAEQERLIKAENPQWLTDLEKVIAWFFVAAFFAQIIVLLCPFK